MWPFNRNKNSADNLKDKVSPTAVKEYYQAAGNRQPWMVWLISIATFLITLIIVLLLFWGGRWVWNKIDNNDDNKATPATQTDKTEEEGANNQPENNPTPSTSAPAPTPAPAPAPQPTPTTTPSTGATNSEHLPNTGPDVDL